MRRILHLTWRLGVPLGLAALISTAVHAKEIVRHCDGSYSMIATLVDGRPAPQGLGWDFGDFSGAGHCGSTVPHRCRERARAKLEECYREHWRVRWNRERPQACTEPAGVSKYALADIKSVMEETVCCYEPLLDHDEIVVNLYGLTIGDYGCGLQSRPKTFIDPSEARRSLLLQADYKMDCSALRKRFCPEYVPKRTNP